MKRVIAHCLFLFLVFGCNREDPSTDQATGCHDGGRSRSSVTTRFSVDILQSSNKVAPQNDVEKRESKIFFFWLNRVLVTYRAGDQIFDNKIAVTGVGVYGDDALVTSWKETDREVVVVDGRMMEIYVREKVGVPLETTFKEIFRYDYLEPGDKKNLVIHVVREREDGQESAGIVFVTKDDGSRIDWIVNPISWIKAKGVLHFTVEKLVPMPEPKAPIVGEEARQYISGITPDVKRKYERFLKEGPSKEERDRVQDLSGKVLWREVRHCDMNGVVGRNGVE